MVGAGEPTLLQGWGQGEDPSHSVLISLLPPAPAAGIRQAGDPVPVGRSAVYPSHFISDEETRASTCALKQKWPLPVHRSYLW